VLFRRNREISRLEGFSDAVFGFALTLLVVSVEVPRDYQSLIERIYGFPAFACCFALLVWIWWEHNAFFRRYDLEDGLTVALNGVLLFVVLLYVYPLKFMFDQFLGMFFRHAGAEYRLMTFDQLASASAIYGLGFLLLFVMFALLYARAYSKRAELELTPIEVFDTRMFAGHHLVSAGVGLVAVMIALYGPRRFVFVSPMAFGLMGPFHWLFGRTAAARRNALLASERLSPTRSQQTASRIEGRS
jgi:uncharacterized membrane protein